MTEVASSVVHEVLGRRALDVDQPIIDYIVNVLADEDFDFGEDGEGAFEAIGELLVGAECVTDFNECRLVSLNLILYSSICCDYFDDQSWIVDFCDRFVVNWLRSLGSMG